MSERFLRTVKQECVWQHNFKSFTHAERVVKQRIGHYNTERMYYSVGGLSPGTVAKVSRKCRPVVSRKGGTTFGSLLVTVGARSN